MLLLLPAMAEGDGCAVMVGTGVMVGVVAGNGRWGGCRVQLLAKKRERRIIIILYNLSYYPMLSQNKSKYTTATVLYVLQQTITCTPVHLIVFCSTRTKKNEQN